MARSIPTSHQHLLETAEILTLATIGPDGFPQVTAVSFALDEDGLPALSHSTATQKIKNLRHHPQCTIFVIDPATPYRTLEIRARADVRPDVDHVITDRIAAKHDLDLRNMTEPGESTVAVRFTPEQVNVFG